MWGDKMCGGRGCVRGKRIWVGGRVLEGEDVLEESV